MTLGPITLSRSDARSARRACVGQRRPERKRSSRAAERTSGPRLFFKRGSGRSGGDRRFRERLFESFLPFGRQRAAGAKLKCPVSQDLRCRSFRCSRTFLGISLAETNWKHRVQSGKAVRIPEEGLWAHYGLVRLKVRERRQDLERGPDAAKPHARFDERGWETPSRCRPRHRHRGDRCRHQIPPPPSTSAPLLGPTGRLPHAVSRSAPPAAYPHSGAAALGAYLSEGGFHSEGINCARRNCGVAISQ